MRNSFVLPFSGPLLVGLLTWAAVADSTPHEVDYDVLITGGRVVDGTGAPWYEADVGIRAGKIAKIGKLDSASATQVLDAAGRVVAPGFIDMMGQTATPMLEDPSSALNLLTQGITTINAGEGASAAPVDEASAASLGWSTMAEYFQLLQLRGLPVNVVQTVGHTQVRRLVIGEDNRRPSAAELAQMQAFVREAMRAGAIGVSTALIYPPAVYAETEEIAALASVAGEFGGRYYTHLRNEGDRLLEAIDEALQIGRSSNTPLHIFHLKAAGRQNWGKLQLAIARIKAARAEGQQVTADIYPYINNGLGIDALIHPRHFGVGRAKFIRQLREDAKLRSQVREEIETTSGWENWLRHAGHDWGKIIIGQTNAPEYRDLAGQSVASIAEAQGEDPWQTFFRLVDAGAFALPETMSDANKILAMQQPFVSFCTDVGPAGGGRAATHPRGFGAFPRLLARYVRDLGAITLEHAIAKASAVAANSVMQYDRGRIAEGLAADVIVFDYQQLQDRATFAAPHELSLGVDHVLVNGEIVLSGGTLTGRRPGEVLRGPGFDPRTAAHHVRSGSSAAALSGVDQVIEAAMRKHAVPGVSLAITDQGRLVHARGYGYADVGSRRPVTPASLFRIASISKPITAVATLQLVQRGQLGLDDSVFDILEVEPHLEADAVVDPRQKQITIRHLLQHRGGWDRHVSFDAMFQAVEFAELLGVAAPADAHAVIRVMQGKPLDYDPGQRYAYSNYGYCLLGRVIETLTGQSYEDYVRENVLSPLGITAMQIGATRLAERREDEVRYYHPTRGTSVFSADLHSHVPHPYGAWHLEAMDSHGGWLATATDLVQFASAFDEPTNCPLLSAELVQQMFARPPGLAGHDAEGQPKASYYGLGWSVEVGEDDALTVQHGGSLPGTNTRLARRPDGRNVALLINARVSSHTARVVNAIWPDLQAAIDQVETWP